MRIILLFLAFAIPWLSYGQSSAPIEGCEFAFVDVNHINGTKEVLATYVLHDNSSTKEQLKLTFHKKKTGQQTACFQLRLNRGQDFQLSSADSIVIKLVNNSIIKVPVDKVMHGGVELTYLASSPEKCIITTPITCLVEQPGALFTTVAKSPIAVVGFVLKPDVQFVTTNRKEASRLTAATLCMTKN